MLEYASLSNFRRHETLKVQFSPQVTVLAGDSKSGKSTIIRALRWVALNRPAGDSVLRWGSDTAKVKLGVDGRTIARRRGPGNNTYKLDDAVYKAFGQDVPGDVSSLLNVSPLFNFSGQHSSPFLFSLTPGEAARELNAVVNLDRIDEVLGNLSAEVRRANSAASTCQQRLEVAEARARAIDWVDFADVALRSVEEAEVELEKVTGKLEAADRVVERVRVLTAKADAAVVDLTELNRSVLEVDGLVVAAERAATDQIRVERVVSKVRVASQRFEAAAREAASSEANLAELAAGRCPLCGADNSHGIQKNAVVNPRSPSRVPRKNGRAAV